jgi:serine/threonine protein phosphatase PrpC
MTEHAAAPNEAASTGRLVIQAALRTDVGLVRSENQDFGTYTTPQEEKGAHPGGRLLIVADGMGGHRGGATASRLAAETVKAQYLGSETIEVPEALRDALQRANSRIFHEAQANPDLRGMGTTTSALAIRGTNAWFGHVGDSRIYRIRGEKIEQLTDDHSLVATMVREGLLTTKEAENHPRRNVLQRSMGVAEDVEIDVRGPFPVEEGDTFILCSDGLHGLVKEDEMREVAQLSIETAADEFLKRALSRGAPDNVTVIVARAVRAEPADEDATLISEAPLDETQPIAAVVPENATDVANAGRTDVGRTLQSGDAGFEKTGAGLENPDAGLENPHAGLENPHAGLENPAYTRFRLLWVCAVIVAAVAAGAWFLWFTR